MKPVGQQGNEIAKHVRRGRETVQQKHRWVLRRTGFAVEDIQSINVNGFVSNRNSLFLLSHTCRRATLNPK
jgi:lysine/ornithine N-monooxygenase